MQHLTMEDFRALYDAQDAPYPTAIQEHLETCERCAVVYNLLVAPVNMGEQTDDIEDSCAFFDDVYELFRNRLPFDRFVPLMSHLLQCEECAGFFEVLWTSEAPTSQATLAREWLESATRALKSARHHQDEILVCEVTNVYAHAASGDDIVVETTGQLDNGDTFTVVYGPAETIFRMPTKSIGQTRLCRFEDDRLIEGWSEMEDGQSGCTMEGDDVFYLHLDSPNDPVGKTLVTMPYSALKKATENKNAC